VLGKTEDIREKRLYEKAAPSKMTRPTSCCKSTNELTKSGMPKERRGKKKRQIATILGQTRQTTKLRREHNGGRR